jgi:glutamine cyclotransferase
MRKPVYFIAFTLVVCFFACKKSSSDPEPVISSLTVSGSTLTLSGDAKDSTVFDIKSNTDWKIISSDTWLTVNPSSGTGDKSIKIIAEANPDRAKSRTATLTISGTGISSKTIVITQNVNHTYAPIFAVLSPEGTFKGGIAKIDPNDGTVLQTIDMQTDPSFEDGLAYDGKLLYYINGRTEKGINKIIQIDPSNVTANDTFATVFPPRMDALAINKKDLFVLDFLQKKIYTVNIDSKTITNTIVPAFTGDAIGGMAFGGSRGTIFVSSFVFGNASTYKVFEINATTGATINSFAVPVSPFGLAYSEGSHVLYMTTGEPYNADKSIYILNPDTGEVIKKFAGSSSALAADESSL